MNTTEPTRRALHPADTAGAAASLLSLVSDPRGSADLREIAIALREFAGTLERIAARREAPSPGAAYAGGWGPHRG